jgi:hypothetical protein
VGRGARGEGVSPPSVAGIVVAAGEFGGALEAKRHPDYKFDFVGVLGLTRKEAR